MKIQGRFIAILAVLGLLIALLPLASVGAVTGVVTLSGGEKGQYFSDQTGDNIATIQVRDADLTPLRIGTARQKVDAKYTKSKTALDLADFVVAGEKEVTERFDGGLDNPLCDDDSNPDTDHKRSADSDVAACDLGDAVALDSDGDALKGADLDADIDSYRFNLDGVARDRQNNNQSGVGLIGPNDIINVVVNGRTALASTTNTGAPEGVGSAPWFTVVEEGGSEPAKDGGGIIAVVLHDVVPQNDEDSVAITFKYTEFDFGSTTPFELEETRVRYGGKGSTGYDDVNTQVTVDLTSGSVVTVASEVSGPTIVSFAYDVNDSFSADKSMVTLNSASAGDVRLAIDETSANSDTFEAKVAVFSQDDYNKIVTQSKANVNDEDGGGSVEVDELNFSEGLSKTVDANNNRSLAARVQRAAEMIYVDKSLSDVMASDFVDKIIPARHDDIINVTYQDINPAVSVSRSARVDLEAPVVELVGPVDGFFTNIATVTMSAEVRDTGAGVDPSKIELKISVGTTGLSRGAAVETPIVNGYRVTAASQGSISEGKKEWFVAVEDKVGNVPATEDEDTEVKEAPLGAASLTTGAADNPFKFTVDTRAPSLSSGKTGLSLKNPGVTSGNNQEEERKNQRSWVRVTFDTGDGGASLDPSTVEANDFRVNDATPLDAKINSVSHVDGTTTIAKGTAVYLQVGQLDSDARPKVELTGEVRDKAGNVRTEGRIANANDGLAPSLTVTPSADIAKDEITITVSSSENLRTNPRVQLTETKPEMGKDPVLPRDLTMSLQTGSLTTWTATFDNESDQASKRYVLVSGSDAAGNEADVGVAANEDDFVSFQLDDKEPALKFVDAGGKVLKDSKQEEGAVWLVMEFDEDEHTGDSYRKVEITEVTLTNMDTDEVVTEDVSTLFGSEVDCVDHDTSSDRYDKGDENNDCAQHTLAVNLTPGMYNVAVTGRDQTGNEKSANVDFEVTEAKPFELTLRPGQNFISIKGMPMGDGGMLDNLFSDPAITSVSTYDRSLELQGANPWLRSAKDLETGMFSGDITMLEPGKAYFVNSDASVTVKVKLQPPGDLPPTIPVRQGYNAIGFWSISGADKDDPDIDLYLGSIGWSVAYTYDPTPGKGWEVIRKGELNDAGEALKIEAGKGYLVYATYDAVLTP